MVTPKLSRNCAAFGVKKIFRKAVEQDEMSCDEIKCNVRQFTYL